MCAGVPGDAEVSVRQQQRDRKQEPHQGVRPRDHGHGGVPTLCLDQVGAALHGHWEREPDEEDRDWRREDEEGGHRPEEGRSDEAEEHQGAAAPSYQDGNSPSTVLTVLVHISEVVGQ